MPRIDPRQLIDCLEVLLTPTGGILSNNEVNRLVSLMTKFSKKLVSKCVYILILKHTETPLLDPFMDAGGWTLVQLWLHDAMFSSNWALVKELLHLLLITPVDVERLKANNIPKLVKSLSKREDLEGIHELSTKLVQQWLTIVKGETNPEQRPVQVAVTATPATVSVAPPQPEQLVEAPSIEETIEKNTGGHIEHVEDDGKANSTAIDTQTFYKLTLKDGKHLISKVDPSTITEASYEVGDNIELVEVNSTAAEDVKLKEKVNEKEKDKDREKGKEKRDDKKKSHDKSKHRSSSSSSKSSSSRDKERNSHRDRDKHSHSNSKDKDRSRDKDKRDKDRRKTSSSVKSTNSSSRSSICSNSSSSSNSSKNKDKKVTKEKQAEKDKDTLAKVQPQSLQKLPKIPKKSSDEKDKSKVIKDNKKEESKKGTMSIEIRKNNEERPKTVKVYKSKMRTTGLEEEAKPAPPRPTKKPGINPPVIIPPPLPLKRPSPIRDLCSIPPEKKTKLETPLDRPGAIKLIPPKPKPPVLQESDMFMDALAASATAKKEPKKRKRRASVSKDSSGTSPPSSPSQNPNPVASPIGLKSIAPPKFYQDTLETEEAKSEVAENDSGKENADANKTDERNAKEQEDRAATPTEDFEDDEKEKKSVLKNGLRGVLVSGRRRGPKKSIKWKPDDELVHIQYFELDETERVNVSKTFGDLAKMDLRGEREALQQMSRKLANEDVMDAQISWKVPMEIDIAAPLVVPGSKSLEKDIQFAREKSVLLALYFSKMMIPDTPGEPDPENYQIKDPILIPIDDVDNPEHDYRDKPWPEPKGSPPQNITNNVPQIFPTNVPVNFQNFGNQPQPPFQNVQQNIQPFPGPPFMPPNVMAGGEWNNLNMANPQMHNSQMMQPNMGPPELMNQGPMNPNIFMTPPENFNPMMNENNHRFPPPFNQQPPGMFPQNNFNPNRGGFGGGFRRGGGNGPWVRMNVPPPGSWNNMRGGGGGGPHRGGRMCNNYRNKGFCRNRENCPFFHPPN